MKNFIKLVIILLILIALSVGCYILLFSLNMKSGIISGILLATLCFVLFCFTIFGMVIGNLKFVGLRNRIEVVGLLTLSIFLALFIGLFTWGNALVEYASPNLDLEEKTRLITSTFFQLSSQSGLLKQERNGITYFFASENEETVTAFDTLLSEEKASFDILLGDTDLSPLTIEIYNDYEVLNQSPLVDRVNGYYNGFNQTIHLSATDSDWEAILLHEYTHYRTHQLGKENGLATINRLPLWFEEGLAEVMGHGIKNFHHGDINQFAITDFHSLDFTEDFNQARNKNLDPYRQSYFAVQLLVTDFGPGAIRNLLLSKTMDDFYERLEQTTKKSLAEFQQSFLGDLVENQGLADENFTLVSEAMEAKNYEQAEDILLKIKENGSVHDISRANREFLEILLRQDLFEESIAQLDSIIENETYGNKTTDLIQQAEIYLLVDTKKALPAIELAKDEVPDDHWLEPRMDDYVEAYRLLNSAKPVAGYKLLFDNDLIFLDKVQNKLHEKLILEYPGEF